MSSLFDNLPKDPPRPDPTAVTLSGQYHPLVDIQDGDLDPDKIEAWLLQRPFNTEFQRISPCDCPLACYLRDLLSKRFPGEPFTVTVNNARVSFTAISSEGGIAWHDLDKMLQNFIKRVDAGGYTQITAAQALSCLQAAKGEASEFRKVDKNAIPGND